MANVLDRQITLEGYRNVVVKFTGVLDTSDVSEAPALRLSDCVNNDPTVTLVGFRVDMLEWAISNPLEVVLEWNGLNPQQITPLSGRGRVNGWNYGGYVPDQTRENYDGNLNLKTYNYPSGGLMNFTVTVELIKLYR